MATRFLLYSHDTYGLGHLRRTTRLANGLVGAGPDNEVLIVTGSPRAQAFSLPSQVDTVKLPCATKDAGGVYRPRRLRGGLGPLVRLRSAIITSTALTFEPDVIVVDHAPIGMAGELIPLLDQLGSRRRRRGPRLVLGLRDIIDDARRVRAAWSGNGVWDRLEDYDDIFVYGDEGVLTTASELELDRRFDVTHTGYLAPAPPEPVTREPFLLVTPGGGGDGHALLRRWLDAVEAGVTEGLRSIMVTGPLLSSDRQVEIMNRAARLDGVDVVSFDHCIRTLMASAVGVVSMAGYNTVAEEMACSVPALLVPRTSPRIEQQIRARRLAPMVGFRHHPVDQLDPERLHRFIDHALSAERRPAPVALDGVGTVSDLLTGRRSAGRRRAGPATKGVEPCLIR